MDFTNFEYISLSGGGTRGFMYIGAFDALVQHIHCKCVSYEEFHRNLKGCAGTSIGALAALFIILGLHTDTIKPLLQPFLQSPHNVAPCLDISKFISKYGFDDGETLREIIRNILHAVGLSPNSTFADLKRLLSKEFVCCTTNIHTGRVKYMCPAMTPDMRIADAVFMSMCVPFLFTPVHYNGELYVDGSMSENLPLYFPDEQTLYVAFESNARCKDVLNWSDYVEAILSCAMSRTTSYRKNTVILFTPDYLNAEGACNLNMHASTSRQYISCGYASMLGYLDDRFYSTIHTLIKIVCLQFLEWKKVAWYEYSDEDDESSIAIDQCI